MCSYLRIFTHKPAPPMPYLLFLIVFFCSLRVSATGTADTTHENYIGYYHGIILAEEAIVAQHYTNALRQYEQLFNAYAYNQPADCYIAAQVAAFTRDTAHCQLLLQRALCMGMPPETAIANPHLKYLYNSLTVGTRDSCIGVYHARLNPEAHAFALSIGKADQQLVASLPPLGLYGRNGSMLKPAYIPFYDSLVNAIAAATERYGFPAERIAGTQQNADSILRSSPYNRYAYLVLIHHGDAWKQLAPLLRKELQRGNLSPVMYGAIREGSDRSGVSAQDAPLFAVRPCQDAACRKQLEAAGIARVNAARREVGLGSYELMEQKYATMIRYRKWRMLRNRQPEPVFDFCCDLHFGS
ncbi:MAG: hypothetical protein QM743_08760 [Chitinophagaceae bacterium]